MIVLGSSIYCLSYIAPAYIYNHVRVYFLRVGLTRLETILHNEEKAIIDDLRNYISPFEKGQVFSCKICNWGRGVLYVYGFSRYGRKSIHVSRSSHHSVPNHAGLSLI